MADDRIVISSGVGVTPEDVATRGFTTAFRGFEQSEVRAFLKRVSEELAASAARERELRRALQEALTRAAHPAIDENTLTSALGEHAARLLAQAREMAAAIRTEAEAEVARLRRNAEEETARLRAEAESVLARRVEEAEGVTSGMRQAAEADARALREQAQAEAEAMVEAARNQGKEMVNEARALRERVLGDLAKRRRVAHVQITQLRAARERLLDAYRVVRRTLDEATEELKVAESEARAAADAAGRRADLEPELPPELEAEIAAVRAGRVPEATATATAAVRPGPSAPPAPVSGSAPPAPAPAPPAAPPAPPYEASAGEPTLPVVGIEPPPAPPEIDVAPPPAPEPAPPEDAAFRPAEPSIAAKVAGGDGSPPAQTVPPPGESETTAERAVTDVIALFAKLRAGQEPSEAPQGEAAAEPSPPEAATSEPAPATNGTGASTEPADVALAGDEAPPASTAEALAEPAPAPADEAGSTSDDEQLLFRRDEVVDPLEADLIRRLKRVLQDEQNELLDRVRRRGRASPASALPDISAQTERYQVVAAPVLEQAVREGAKFAASAEGIGEPGDDTDAAAETDAETDTPADGPTRTAQLCAADLSLALIAPLRERLERALEEAAGEEDETELLERLSASYRQWKIEQIEELARHHTAAAFTEGTFVATPSGLPLRWIVDDPGPCPDCDDNALAGPTPKGQAYPTGQLHPPAHMGCRCLLVPATT